MNLSENELAMFLSGAIILMLCAALPAKEPFSERVMFSGFAAVVMVVAFLAYRGVLTLFK